MDTNEQFAPRAAINKAIELVSSGQVDAAVEFCRVAIEKSPGDVNMVALLGVTLMKSGALVEAEAMLRRAIQLAPRFAKPYEDLGYLLVEAGRAEEAVDTLKQATNLDPSAEQSLFTLGRALALLGRGDEADSAFEASFALNPERKRLALAAEHHKAGRQEQAAEQYRALLADFPKNVDAMRLLAGILVNQTQFEEAEALLRHAISLAPDFSLALLDLGRLLQEQHRYPEAIECFERTVKLEPDSPKPVYRLASVLAPLGRTEEALENYKKVLRMRPQHAGALLGAGHTLKTIGRQDEAIEAYRKCLDVKSNNGETYWSLANLKTYQLTDNDINEMQAAVADGDSLTEQSLVNFLFALAKASEDKGDYERAWDYYTRGNTKQRMLEHYDPVQTEVAHDEIITVFNADFLKEKGGLGNPDAAPIFVVGLPRSGSTLIEQILASHSQVEGTAELPYLGRVAVSLNRGSSGRKKYPFSMRDLTQFHFNALGENYLRQAQAHRMTDRPFFVDKTPNNFPSIGLINLILPNAKIIDARRYPLDSALSCYRQLFAQGQTYVYDLSDVGEFYLQYQRMMDHWHEVLPGRVLTVQYEDVVTNFESQVRRLLDFCGLPWEDGCAKFYETDRPVRTASSEQVRQPVYTKSVHFWRNYESQLGELIEILEPILPRYEKYESINR